MGHPSTLYRFRVDLSDVDRGVYGELDFRVALHPSETPIYLLTRVFAYLHNADPEQASLVEFTPGGLSDPDAPCLRSLDGLGGIRLWVEVGNPSARKLHKAAKASERVKVYTYKDPSALQREVESAHVHAADEIELYALSGRFLEGLAARLERDNRWSVLFNDGSLNVTVGENAHATEFSRLSLKSKA